VLAPELGERVVFRAGAETARAFARLPCRLVLPPLLAGARLAERAHFLELAGLARLLGRVPQRAA
jgi:hypothetical protein